MTSCRVRSVCIATLLPLLVGCGGGSATGTAQPAGSTQADTSQSQADTSQSQEDGSSVSAGGSSRAGAIDVCALLSEADAAAVARERGLNGAQTADTKYTLKTTKVVSNQTGGPPMSGCKFSIDGEGASGTIEIDVVPGDNISLYSDGQKVPGLGDEAYSGGGLTVVRVGDLMLQTSENSFTQGFAVALYRKMIPKLK